MTLESDSQPVGMFYSWWRGDAIPHLPPLMDLTIEAAEVDSLATAPFLDLVEATKLNRQGHRLYLARLGDKVAAFGWEATSTASIGELGVELRLPPGNRYLWGFVTLPKWRGKGIYPRLLQAILNLDADAERFWIGHDYGNVASARGIAKAGFTPTGEVYQDPDDGLRFAPTGQRERSNAAAALLGIPVAQNQAAFDRPEHEGTSS